MRYVYGCVGFDDSQFNIERIRAALGGETGATSAATAAHHFSSNCALIANGADVSVVTHDGNVLVLLGKVKFAPSGDWVEASAILDQYNEKGAIILSELYGEFSCVVVDGKARRCYIANDRFGSIPIYYQQLNGGVAFGTRLQQLITLSGQTAVDPQAVYNYVFFHCIPSPRTIYRDISKLGPASLLKLENTQLSATRYWEPNFVSEKLSTTDLAAAENALRDGLRDAVSDAASLQNSGAFLSGGLDSSTVAGMLKSATGKAATFTVGFDEPQYDESGFARTSSQHFETDHHEIILAPRHVADALEKMTEYLDEPFGNSSVIPTYYCAVLARENGYDRLLAGDGGDELFAGNTRYVEQRAFERYGRVPKPLRSLLELGYAIAPFTKQLPIASKGWGYITKANMGLPDRLQAYNFLNQFDPSKVFNPDFLRGIDHEEPWQGWRKRYNEVSHGTSLQRMLYLDWKFTLADNDLLKVSNMCALAGINVSYPMLDARVVDASLRVDSESMLLNNDLRGFYKHAWRDFLPPSVFTKSKHGFGLPFGVWMRKDPQLQGIAASALQSLRQREIFRTEFIDTALSMHNTDSPGYYGELVWIMLVLELWMSAHA